MDYEALHEEITTGPMAAEFVEHIESGADGAIADLLNQQNSTRIMDLNVNARTILSKLGATNGSTFLEALDAIKSSIPAVKWSMYFLLTPEGINVGDPETRGMLDQLATGGVLTTESVAIIKALAVVPASRAEIVFGQMVSGDDVAQAFGRGGQNI